MRALEAQAGRVLVPGLEGWRITSTEIITDQGYILPLDDIAAWHFEAQRLTDYDRQSRQKQRDLFK